jgi:hypothetical protein
MPVKVQLGRSRPREDELVRACACYRPDDAHASLIRYLASRELDWDYISHTAEHHRLIPLVYRNLSHICGSRVPKHVLWRFQQAHFTNATHNLRLTGELLRLLALLGAAGIQAVPFKGPVLAELLFGNVSLRQFGDLDILVRQGDVRRARELLVADGYKAEFELKGKFEAEYIRSEHAFQFQKESCGFVVELHWRFGARNQVFPVNSKDVWSRLEERTFQGCRIAGLAREDLLLYLCAHGAKHGWDRLEWISCLSELIRHREGMDWEVVTRRAEEAGALRVLHVGLLLADSLLPLKLPPTVLERMRSDAAAQALSSQAREKLFIDEPDHSRREVWRQTFYLRARERWADRARILFFSSARVPHPLAKDWNLFKVPVSMSFLYYLLRPIRLMREYGFRRLRALL